MDTLNEQEYRTALLCCFDGKAIHYGQAPGEQAQRTMIIWNDRSGIRLREWMGVSDEIMNCAL
ncbi:hypothetical protein ABWW58_10140 [Sporolactobacillus sp. STCC-11]|uniref:hypothetical protein n=1 Tax=Sporolactobacillus caesalpiniae TaxID=3230362 RepID=UPI003394FA5C